MQISRYIVNGTKNNN